MDISTDQLKTYRRKVKALQKKPQPAQRTPEWYTFRKNRLTASDLGTVIGVNPYEKYNSVVQKKCGYERPFIMNNNIRRGVKFEEVICKVYEKFSHYRWIWICWEPFS